MIITQTTERIAQAAFALDAARLEDFPFVYMLTYTEAHEFLNDLIRSGSDYFVIRPLLTDQTTLTRERLLPWDFNPPAIPHPRSGKVIWCTYRGITLGIKGDQDQ